MKKIFFFGTLIVLSFIYYAKKIDSKRSFSNLLLDNVEALSDQETPDTDPYCYGTGSVDCSKWDNGKVVTDKVERKTSGDYKSRRLVVY